MSSLATLSVLLVLGVVVFGAVQMLREASRPELSHRQEVERFLTFRYGPVEILSYDGKASPALVSLLDARGRRLKVTVGQRAYDGSLEVLSEDPA